MLKKLVNNKIFLQVLVVVFLCFSLFFYFEKRALEDAFDISFEEHAASAIAEIRTMRDHFRTIKQNGNIIRKRPTFDHSISRFKYLSSKINREFERIPLRTLMWYDMYDVQDSLLKLYEKEELTEKDIAYATLAYQYTNEVLWNYQKNCPVGAKVFLERYSQFVREVSRINEKDEYKDLKIKD